MTFSTIDGVQVMTAADAGSTYYTVTLNAFQKYSCVIEVTNTVGPGAIYLYWTNSLIPPKELVHKSNFGYAQDVADSPYQLTVGCQTGYVQVGTQWLEALCDDGNIIDGDGCSSDYTEIEDGWVCTSSQQKSICTKCESGYIQSENKDKCIQKSFADLVNSATTVASGSLFMSILMNFLVRIFNARSTINLLSFFNPIQLFLLMPLIGTYMPPEVINYMQAFKFWMFSLNFLNLKGFSHLKYPQLTPYLSLVGLTSSSVVANLSTAFIVLLILIFITLWVWIFTK